MKKEAVIQDYYGGLYFIKKNKYKELTIFIVDDNEIYLNLLNEELSENPKFSIHAFSTGEECLKYLSLKPDLVILDYHLDGVHEYAQKGDIIFKKIKAQLPQAEVVIISSDHKLAFIKEINKKIPQGIMFKNSYTTKKLKYLSNQIIKRGSNKIIQSIMTLSGIIIFILFIIMSIKK